MTMMTVFRNADGAIENIGPWDYKFSEVQRFDEAGQVVTDENGAPVVDRIAGNPMPDSLAEDEAYIIEGPDGGLYEAGDPRLVSDEISDRQFAQALADQGTITQAEALAFVKRGEVPTTLQAAIDGIPDADARFAVEMQVSGATTFKLSHPTTAALASALGYTPKQMIALWKLAASFE
ncbi:hypothetical protein ASF36_22045 [Methylobacterium sp. Leaf90]|nr:hypothetical protein ASF36_22045 [Methylobacterium sp. Leaf90]